MERLRPLTEAECYARLYGQREPTVTVIPVEAREPPWPTMAGERLRRAFEERLDLRDGADAVDAEAA
jgi:hypothetical protein